MGIRQGALCVFLGCLAPATGASGAVPSSDENLPVVSFAAVLEFIYRSAPVCLIPRSRDHHQRPAGSWKALKV